MEGRTDEVDPLCDLVPFDFVLIEDLMEAASDLSVLELGFPASPALEDLGLSDFPPGIFERIDMRREREDSFVSDLEKEGSDSRPGPDPFPSEPLALEGVLPISTSYPLKYSIPKKLRNPFSRGAKDIGKG